MKKMIEQYGGMMISVIVTISLCMLLGFREFKGRAGLWGGMGYLGEKIIEQASTEALFPEAFLEEKEKTLPHIYRKDSVPMMTGIYIPVEDCFYATDSEGKMLSVRIDDVVYMDGTKIPTQWVQATECFYFELAGVYQIYISAVDEEHRMQSVMLKIPVNKGGGI